MSFWLTEKEFRSDRVGASHITLNVAFLQEIKEDNIHLTSVISDLRQNLANQSERDPKYLVEKLGLLRDALETHFALEEFYGYFRPAKVTHSQISARADALRSQHESIYLEVCELVELSESVLYHEQDVAEGLTAISKGFDKFVRHLDDHEQKEMDLMMQLCNDEIGVGD